ncbi:MAG: ROK family protein [Pseudomonadota bacterium]
MSLANLPSRSRWWRQLMPRGAEGEMIGLDFAGAMLEAGALDAQGRVISTISAPRPASYEEALKTVQELVGFLEKDLAGPASVGVSVPGSVSPRTGAMRNANFAWLNGRPLRDDLSQALARPVGIANDSDCLALSEVVDGAAQGAQVAFAAFIGAGVGGGLVVSGKLVAGANGVGGEWGHTPLPWAKPEEAPGPVCWCGRHGCVETWVSEGALERLHLECTGEKLPAQKIVTLSNREDAGVEKTMHLYCDRLARALASLCTVLDPDVIVLGGAMANAQALYTHLPERIRAHVFSDVWDSRIVKARWGASSSLRGAARLNGV